MKRIITSAVTDFTIQQPFPTKSLDFLQEGLRDMFAYNSASLYTPHQSTLSPLVLYGMVSATTGNMISDGVFFGGGFNPEIFYCTGADTTGYVNPPLAVPDLIASAADPIMFTDNVSRNVHQIRQYKIVDQPAGITSSYLYSAFIFKQLPVRTIATGGSWTGTASCVLHDGTVHMKGLLSILGSGTIAPVPLGYRPNATKTIPTSFYDDGNYIAGAIKIGADGAITFDANFAGSSIRGALFDGIRFNLGW